MSHIVQIKSQVKDTLAVTAACRRLGLAEPVEETVRLFSAQATGLAVRLPNWRQESVASLSLQHIRSISQWRCCPRYGPDESGMA